TLYDGRKNPCRPEIDLLGYCPNISLFRDLPRTPSRGSAPTGESLLQCSTERKFRMIRNGRRKIALTAVAGASVLALGLTACGAGGSNEGSGGDSDRALRVWAGS